MMTFLLGLLVVLVLALIGGVVLVYLAIQKQTQVAQSPEQTEALVAKGHFGW
jgi:threonine/homoserine/homoserine lactone efflux protein